MKRVPFLLIGMALSLQGCLYQPVSEGGSEDAGGPGDVVEDATDVSDADGADGGDVEPDGGDADVGPECVDAAQCPDDKPNVNGVCQDGACGYECKDDYFAPNGEIAENGCTCQKSNGGVETCDGEDNDCDGETDEDPEPQACEEPGVCQNASIASCRADGMGYETCPRSKYAALDDFADAPDEAWRCDGLDNNCDGTADEVCCGAAGNPTQPTSVQIGAANANQSSVSVIPAHPSAPDDSAYLVSWVEDGEAFMRHVDRTGSVVSGSSEQNITGESGIFQSGDITRFDVAAYSDGYVMGLVVDPTLSAKEVFAMTVAGDLSGEPESRTADAGVDGDTNLQIVSDSNRALMVFSDAIGSAEHDIKSTSFTPSDLTTVPSSPSSLSDSDRGDELPRAGKPAAAVFPSGEFVVAWWDAEGKKVQGARLDQAGTDTGSFRIDVQATSSVDALALDVFAHLGGDVTVVHPHIPQTTANLYATRFSGTPDNIVPDVQLLDSNSDSLDPSIAPIFASGGGNAASHLMVSWNEGTIIKHGRVPLPLSSQALANAAVLSNTDAPERSALATGVSRDQGVGAVWLRAGAGSSFVARFAPISWNGVAICGE